MSRQDIPGVVALQSACFPPPFPQDLLWNATHLNRHLDIFHEGQYVCESNGVIVGSGSASLISQANWNAHLSWEQTLGGFMFETYDPNGTTMYGADISVHPDYRKKGIAKQIYLLRFETVKKLGLTRYGTACRIPDFQAHYKNNPNLTTNSYATLVSNNYFTDRTLSPLLKMGLNLIGVIDNYMEDFESNNSAALLEWKP